MTSKSALDSVSQLFGKEVTREALDYLRYKDNAITVDTLIDAIYHIGEQKSKGTWMSSSLPTEEERLREALAEEKQYYLDLIEDVSIKCRVCYEAKANILLLPCGHLVSCDQCLCDVSRCPIGRCNKIVRGTKEVYFA
jgi:hypothetical protein